MIKVFGIRHHGPGSSRSMLSALAEWAPDCILVEMPEDSLEALEYALDSSLLLPAAILIYSPSNLSMASYLPFADFSPEWQAIKYAAEKKIELQPIDLPMSIAYSTPDEKEEQFPFQSEINEEERNLMLDPLGYLAGMAGYRDRERWWEATFERRENPARIFEEISDMMRSLRESLSIEKEENLVREAFMREKIRSYIKKGYDKIAVICGAWHSPALVDLEKFKSSEDKKAWKGIKKIKTRATWVPWSYERLTFSSGYGAGVLSPAWYEFLFRDNQNAAIDWFTKAGEILRKEDMASSTANIIEGVRMARTLATLRMQEIPGIEELKEAMISTVCNGDEEQFRFIEKKLVTGEKFGEIPPSFPGIPLQKDLEDQIRSLRLKKDREAIGIIQKKLDLRKENHLAISQLLYRLEIMEIPWGKKSVDSSSGISTFGEHWNLQWFPDFAIRIIEMGMYGNTVEEASSAFLIEKGGKAGKPDELTSLVGLALKAGLIEPVPSLIGKLNEKVALTTDILHLLETLVPLAGILRYGSVRNLDVDSIWVVMDSVIPRVAIGLPSACIGINDEASESVANNVLSASHAIMILKNKNYEDAWISAIESLATMDGVSSLIKGMAVRLLFDREHWPVEKTLDHTFYALSSVGEVHKAANWIEGFLQGSGLILIHHPQLWGIIDDWIDSVPFDTFYDILPALRRSFSNFSPSERQKMLSLAMREEDEELITIGNRKEKQDYPAEILSTLQLLLED